MLRALNIAVLSLACIVFLFRGIIQGIHGNDFATPFVSAGRLLSGEDPYAKQDLQSWLQHGIHNGLAPDDAAQYPVYPPPTLLLIAPFAAMGWAAGLPVYMALTCGLYLFLVYLLVREIDGPWSGAPRVIFLVFALCMGPVLTGISKGNLSILALVLCGLAMVALRSGQRITSGVLLGLVCCLKPTVGAPFALILLMCWKLDAILSAAVTVIAVTIPSLLWVRTVAPQWSVSYRANVQEFFRPDSGASWQAPGALKFDLLNLQLPLYQLTHSILFSNATTWLCVATIAAVWVVWGWQRKQFASWQAIATIGLLSLLPVYQRNYNAGVVLFAVLWACLHLHRSLAKAILGLSLLAILPMEGFLRRHAYGCLPESILQGSFWNAFVMPELIWVILLLTLAMLWAMKDPATGAESSL